VPAPIDIESGRASRLSRGSFAIAAISLALALTTFASAPAEAVDLSGAIAATRSSQLGLQATMRHLDRAIRHLRHDRRVARKRIRHARRSYARMRQHAGELSGPLAVARIRLADARAALGRITDVSAPPDDAASTLGPVPGREPDDRVEPPTNADTTVMPMTPSGVAPASSPDGTAQGRSQAESRVRDSEMALRALERSERRFLRKAGHFRRVMRKQSRRAAGIRRRIVGSEHGLAGTEAALASQIMTMTRLARARAAKKTKRGPLRAGFGWPAHGRLTQPYGCTGFGLAPRRGSCAHFHDGIDIAGALGTPIRAAATGVVAYVGWNPWDHEGRAYIVVIGHGGGFVTRYGHLLPRHVVTVGHLVRKGQLIGYMGSTGNSTGPHLHMELLRGSVTVNPLAYL
jgi:murein DD-endopeptidase MepM/ murein hydrolase activator NlpD